MLCNDFKKHLNGPDFNSILADFFSFAEKASSPFSWNIFSASSEEKIYLF
jgi:hypothetical protein